MILASPDMDNPISDVDILLLLFFFDSSEGVAVGKKRVKKEEARNPPVTADHSYFDTPF